MNEEILKDNNRILSLYADYLNNNERLITEKLINNFLKIADIGKEKAFVQLLALSFDLDFTNQDDCFFIDEYLTPSIKMLNKDDYLNNQYLTNVKPKPSKNENWDLTYEAYLPYEGFIYNDLELYNDYKTLPRLGFFDSKFSYLCVKENQNIWMSITPNEINTMQKPIEEAFGNVITFGLGLGYFAYMCLIKENVSKVTVIEKDPKVIKLFNDCIRPYFPNKELNIIECDAFEYIENPTLMNEYDYAFFDLWHDASDGIPMYLKLKKYEPKFNQVKCSYWIEKTINLYFMWHLYLNYDILVKEGKINKDLLKDDLLNMEMIKNLSQKIIL